VRYGVTRNLALLIAAAFMGHQSIASSVSRSCNVEITARAASSLVHLAVEHQIAGLKSKGHFSLDQNTNESDSRFYTFEALGTWNTGPSSAVIGNYAINRRTATIWDMTTCKRIGFRDLIRMQARYCKHRSSAAMVRPMDHFDDPPSLC